MSQWTGTLTLTQCNGIILKIKNMLWLGNRKNNVPTMFVPVNMGDLFLNREYVCKNVEHKLSKLEEQLELQELLYKTLYLLRAAVVQENCNCGTNDVLAQITLFSDLKELYKTLHSANFHDTVDRGLLKSLNTGNDVPQVDSLFTNNRVVSALSKEELTDKLQEIDIELNRLERKRDQLNNEAHINFSMPLRVAKLLSLE